MKLEFFLALFAYFVLLILVSFIFSKRMKSLEDFFLASRNLPSFLVFLSLSASWFGATSILVSADEAYKTGVSSFWIMGVPAVLTVLVLGFFLARPIRRLPIVTLPDLVEKCYGRTVRHMASLSIIWYMAVLAASQMVALGQFLKFFLGTPYLVSMALGLIVVLIYSVCGGFFSVVITDSLQFFLLVAGVFGLFFFLYRHIQQLFCAGYFIGPFDPAKRRGRRRRYLPPAVYLSGPGKFAVNAQPSDMPLGFVHQPRRLRRRQNTNCSSLQIASP